MDPIRRRLVRLTRGGLTAVSVEPPGAGARALPGVVPPRVARLPAASAALKRASVAPASCSSSPATWA